MKKVQVSIEVELDDNFKPCDIYGCPFTYWGNDGYGETEKICVLDWKCPFEDRQSESKNQFTSFENLVMICDSNLHGKQYHFKQDDGSWYSRKVHKSITEEEVVKEISDELYDLDF